MPFKNKVAIVTGAGQGICFEICSNLVKQGARVILNDVDEALAIKAKRMKKDIRIICIEPGFVDTKMVEGYKRFWVVPLDKAARQIIAGIEKKKQKVYISKRWWLIARLMRLAPFWLYKKFG